MAMDAPITGGPLCAPVIPPAARAAIERAIDRLIALLDYLDGDADREADGDELDHDGDETFAMLHGNDFLVPWGELEDDEEEEDCCSAGDDGCGMIVRHGVHFWGSHHDDAWQAYPANGVDQSQGPIGVARLRGQREARP